jgi:hypothetical protein
MESSMNMKKLIGAFILLNIADIVLTVLIPPDYMEAEAIPVVEFLLGRSILAVIAYKVAMPVLLIILLLVIRHFGIDSVLGMGLSVVWIMRALVVAMTVVVGYMLVLNIGVLLT